MWFTDVAASQNPGREELQRFVIATMAFLTSVMEESDFRFLWGNDRDLFGLASLTFKTDVHESADHLLNVIPFIPQAGLDIHGLEGRPMRFKLRVIDSIASQWERLRGQLNIREWFRKMVEAIDAVLDSLIAAAGGVGGIIKEFKDALMALA